MEPIEAYNKLLKSRELKDWKEKADFKLMSLLCHLDPSGLGDWNINFYRESDNTTMTFTIGKEIIVKQDIAAQPVAQDPLDMSQVKKGFSKIVEKAKESSPDEIIKAFVILKEESHKPVYNFICILKNHKMINIKINAETSEPQSIETVSFAEPGSRRNH